MERISALKTPTPVLALIELPRYRLSAGTGTDDLALALDGVQDPGNLGTIVRLADWFGIRDIVCSENTADCFGPKAVQATMGAIARVRVHYTALESFLTRAAERGTPVYGTFLEGEDLPGRAFRRRHRRDGQRRKRHLVRNGPLRYPAPFHTALSGSGAHVRVAERGDGHGGRSGRVPAPHPLTGRLL